MTSSGDVRSAVTYDAVTPNRCAGSLVVVVIGAENRRGLRKYDKRTGVCAGETGNRRRLCKLEADG
jgi:hypothetical protein